MPNRVVIYGGRGGLGSTLVKSFKSKGKIVARKSINRNIDKTQLFKLKPISALLL